MKKDKSKRRNRDDDDADERPAKKGGNSKIDEYREMWGDGEGEGDDERYDKLKEGKNYRRVLPNKNPDEPFFVSFAMHFNMGPDGEDKFRCIEPGGPFGHSKKKDKQRNYKAKLCPACKVYCRNKSKARAFPYQSKEGKAFWNKKVAPWRAKHRFIWAQNAPKSKENRRKVFVFETGIMIGKPLVEAFYDENMGGDFTDPKTGRLIVITKTKLGQKANEVEYDTRISPNREPLKLWKKLKKKLPDLNSFIPEALEPDAILAIMEGDGDSRDDDDDDRPRKKKSKKGRRDRDDDADLDDIDDDDDDEGGSRREKLARRRRGRDEEVDPDEEEEDDDSDDDDDDEKPSKKKKKKSKLRDKLKKKARRDDDDDDDEGDDDDDDDEEEDDSDDDSDEEDEEDEDSDDDDDEDDDDEDEDD